MTPKQIGAQVFNERAQSPFATREWVMKSLDLACEQAAAGVRVGFYEAEMLSKIKPNEDPPPPPLNRKQRRARK